MRYKHIIIILCLIAFFLAYKSMDDTPVEEEDDTTVESIHVEVIEVEPDLEVYHKPATEYAVLPSYDASNYSVDITDYVSEEEIIILAKTCYGEARGMDTQEVAAVVWCVLNRVDADGYACGESIEHVITFPNQFTGYVDSNPVVDEYYDIVLDVLSRWVREKNGETDVGRVLPKDYLWFSGDYHKNKQDPHNYFRNKYDHYDNSNIWDWSLDNPYDY